MAELLQINGNIVPSVLLLWIWNFAEWKSENKWKQNEKWQIIQTFNFVLLCLCRIISSNRSHIVKLPLSRVRQSTDLLLRSHWEFSFNVTFYLFVWQQLKFMHTSHQFLLLSSPPAKEARFRTAKKLYGSTFAFQ